MNKILLYISSVFILAFSSCKKDSDPKPDPKAGLIKITEAYALGASAKVELWAEKELSTGYQKLFIALYDSVSSQPLNKAAVSIVPVMDMNMNGHSMSHSAPFENPEGSQAENSLFPCAAVFTMPSTGEDGKWRLEVNVKKEGQTKAGKAVLQLQVKQPELERVKTITAADESRLTVSYILSKPRVGINDIEIIIHRRQDMMNFPAAADYTIVMAPEMPSMGHGSPNNVNPVHVKNGHYKGKVNFTMTGDWRINLELNKDGKTTPVFFDLVF